MARVRLFDRLRPSGDDHRRRARRGARRDPAQAALMRLALVAVFALAACSEGASEPAPKVAEGAEKIACALGPGTGFSPSCAIERSRDKDGTYRMIVRHPDGGFRRFEVGQDNVLVTSDGADRASVKLDGETAEVGVGEDRYRIPLERRTDAAKP